MKKKSDFKRAFRKLWCVHFLRFWHVALPAAFCRVHNYRKYENQLQREIPEIPNGRRFFWHQHGNFEMKIKEWGSARFVSQHTTVLSVSWRDDDIFFPFTTSRFFASASRGHWESQLWKGRCKKNDNNNHLKKFFCCFCQDRNNKHSYSIHNHLFGIDGGALEEPLNAPGKPPY